jgi:SAM-dependent methyltransferase
VIGVDLSAANVQAGREAARLAQLEDLARFELADAERLPFDDGAFDAVICECAFCLFPDKGTAAHEIARVLRAGGMLGFTDLVRDGPLEPALEGLMAWVACIADAQPLDSYIQILRSAGLDAVVTERHDTALAAVADQTRQRLFSAELLAGLGKLSWPGFDFPAANALVRGARDAIGEGRLGYALLVARRSARDISQGSRQRR